MKRLSLVLFSVLAWSLAQAEDAPPAPLPEPPPLPPQVQSGETLEPDVTIVEKDKETVYEYRVNGQLYMVRVVPQAGPPYYFLDSDGDGKLDARQYDPREVSGPQWLLFEW